jgi:DNA-binding winged helix-turn-helix (wHTH) protein/tetratricopeptide (TPR) repeat protein
MSMQTDTVLRFANYDVDPVTRSLRRDGERIPLNRRSFDVLLLLLQHPGEVVSREELIKQVWPDTFVDENTLSQSISALRRSLAERPGDNSYIATLPGRGYQFVAPVRQTTHDGAPLPAPAASVMVLEERTMRTSVITQQDERVVHATSGVRHSIWAVGIAALALIAAAGLGGWRYIHPARAQEHHELVVSEFDNQSGEPIFDSVLKSALTIDLEQSPYLSLANEREIEQALGLMKLPQTAHLTGQIATDVCQRVHSDAYLSGTVARVGQEYLLTLAATDCGSGRPMAQAKAVSTSKEGVLKSLDNVAASLRKQLGETSASIHDFNVPIEQATTFSLDALKSYSEARELRRLGKTTESIPLFERAISLDPNFAMAYAKLGAAYENLHERSLERQNIARAYALSDGVSADEKLYIEGIYYECVEEDLDAALRVYRTQAETYPSDPIPLINMTGALGEMGRHADEVETAQRAMALTPRSANAYATMATAYLRTSQFAQAKAICAEAEAAGQASADIHNTLFEIAMVERDAAAMARESGRDRGKPTEAQNLNLVASSQAAQGQLHSAERLFDQAKALAIEARLTDARYAAVVGEAEMERLLGAVEQARSTVKDVPENLDDISFEAAVNAALSGDTAYAHRVEEQLIHSTPESSTLARRIQIPVLRAAIALHEGKAAEAVALLEPARAYEFRDYSMMSLRGEAHLALHRGTEAEADFREILANPGLDPVSPMYSLAHLGLARALAQQGHAAQAAESYRRFLEAWNNADPNLPVLQQAREELARLGPAART